MATTPITDTGKRTFICGKTTTIVTPGGPIDVQASNGSLRINPDEVNDLVSAVNDLVSALQHAQTYSTTAPLVPVVVG